MSDTLRDQLLGLGFKPAPKPDRPPRRDAPSAGKPRPAGARPAHDPRGPDPRGADPRGHDPRTQGARKHAHAAKPKGDAPRQHGKPRRQEDIDLAKAYAIRAQREKDERIAVERAKQEEARLRREARAKLTALVEGRGLNDPEADLVRHFDYGGKIKRIHVNADQLRDLNAGALGVLQLNGRYLLVDAAMLAEAETIYAPAVALKVDPDAPVADDPYADPQYQVPDDLVW